MHFWLHMHAWLVRLLRDMFVHTRGTLRALVGMALVPHSSTIARSTFLRLYGQTCPRTILASKVPNGCYSCEECRQLRRPFVLVIRQLTNVPVGLVEPTRSVQLRLLPQLPAIWQRQLSKEHPHRTVHLIVNLATVIFSCVASTEFCDSWLAELA